MTKKPFEFLESISYTKEDLLEDRDEKDYVPYLINKSLSYHSDGVLYANEMNFWRDLDRKLQYDYLRLSVRRRKRSGVKWSKPEESEAVEAISFWYQLSPKKAREALLVMSGDHVSQLIQEMKKTHGTD